MNEWFPDAPSDISDYGKDEGDDEDEHMGNKLARLTGFPLCGLFHGSICRVAEAIIDDEYYERAAATSEKTDFGEGIYFFKDFDKAWHHAELKGKQAMPEGVDSVDLCIIFWPFPEASDLQYCSEPRLSTHNERPRWRFDPPSSPSAPLRIWDLVDRNELCCWHEMVVYNRGNPKFRPRNNQTRCEVSEVHRCTCK